MSQPKDRLLTVDQTADRFNTGPRFVRRLIAERRITYVRVGRHVRIPESAVESYLHAGTVAPITNRKRAA